MSTQKRSGFTIIEVMLFLAITGALAVGILASSGVAIDQQRYRDSVNSFKGLIQEQYGQVTNVINGAAKNPDCTLAGRTLTFDDSESAQQFRGTSDCLLLGRFLLVKSERVTAYDVIGQQGSGLSLPAGSGDSATLQSYGIALRTPETYDINWGARLVNPKGASSGVPAGLLIVRSPLSGSILTYVGDIDEGVAPEDYTQLHVLIKEMINDGGNMAKREFCVDPGGMTVSRNRLAVRVAAKAANQSAVEIALEKDGICD